MPVNGAPINATLNSSHVQGQIEEAIAESLELPSATEHADTGKLTNARRSVHDAVDVGSIVPSRVLLLAIAANAVPRARALTAASNPAIKTAARVFRLFTNKPKHQDSITTECMEKCMLDDWFDIGAANIEV
ncbi:hypothetical protein FRC06_008332 [Ceratobasidium sp. 370]|nr:hypothetical protein FRC06_008332 [Ceratobasidium sp. 370]